MEGETGDPGINELRRAVHTLHAEGRPDVFPSTVSAELSECVYEAFDSKEMGVIAALSGGEVWGYAVVEYTEKPASPPERAAMTPIYLQCS